MRIIVYIILGLLFFSCKEKGVGSVKTFACIPKCDTASIMLLFYDSINGKLKNGIMAIFYKGVEEDFTSVFRDSSQTYPLGNRDYICLKKSELYLKYYASPADTIFGKVYQKGLGYSQGFDIVLSKNINRIYLKWDKDDLPGVPESLLR